MIHQRQKTSSDAFLTTHWTRVLEARGDSPDAKIALGELCEAYYPPVFAFIRRRAPSDDAARDLTQEFFRRQLEREGIKGVNPAHGRFRSYLLGAVMHFLADARDHANAQKRGGGRPAACLDAGTDTSPGIGFEVEDTNAPNPEREFDKKWALTLLSHALDALAEDHRKSGSLKEFETLKAWLTGDADHISQGDTARKLGMNEGAVKVAIHRLRKAFRQQIKNEIAKTVKNPDQVAEEMRCLLVALG
ncbi:MAG TPA: sigma-70 family RNA polymerase sigma factor [Verrucomicrobiae bacterium]|nr:sigma-70 family RNA polymerase sigma factor [Verrucomicrobiae bacterium]